MNIELTGRDQSETATDSDRLILETLRGALTKLRPIFMEEGGDARIVSVKNGIARIELLGGCEGCGGGIEAMAGGLRLMLIERVPGLKEVVFE
ncbi:NifU family protein [bacterium]|nr:NifU family protein [bacterium]MBU1983773.1 NifU family protein [bacterium]